MKKTIIFWGFILLFAFDQKMPAKENNGLILAIPLFAKDTELKPDYVAQLNAYLNENDIVFVRGKPTHIKLIKEVKKAQIAIIRQSLIDLERDIKFINGQGVKFDYICYNPEAFGSSNTPEEEKNNLLEAVKKTKELADKNKVKLIVVPDSKITLPKLGSQMAKHADIFAVQLQAWQLLSNDEFLKTARDLINGVKKGNPRVSIIAQLSVNPPSGKRDKGKRKIYTPVAVSEMLSKVELIEELIDGVGFLLFEEGEGLERFQEFIKNYRKEGNYPIGFNNFSIKNTLRTTGVSP